MHRLALLALLALTACADADVRDARKKSDDLRAKFASKQALIARYAEFRAQIEAAHAELDRAPEKPFVPTLPPVPPADLMEEAKAARFPEPPMRKPRLLGMVELRRLELHFEDVDEEMARLDEIVDRIQDLGKVRRKLEAARLALAAQRRADAVPAAQLVPAQALKKIRQPKAAPPPPPAE